MELIIMKINTDNIGNQNIRTYIADKEDVIIDFIGMISGKYDIADIEAIIDRCVCQGNSMDVGYSWMNHENVHYSWMNHENGHYSLMNHENGHYKANNMKDVHYRIKFIDDYHRKVCIDV